jgi:dTDP-4-amino-4,6-dideoxygalactose transaminase
MKPTDRPQIPAARVHFSESDRREILEMIDRALQSGRLTLGEFGLEFEHKFAAAVGRKHAIAVNSGTSALEIPLRILEASEREVILPANTFMATALAVIHSGATVRFVDIELPGLGLDPAALDNAVSGETAGIITVHIGGIVSPDVEKLRTVAEKQGIFFIEDAAHAHAAFLDNKAAGAFGTAASFSFYPTKLITSGEGGMIVTDDDDIDRWARVYRDQGKEGFTSNYHVRPGYNWRMSELHAAVGLVHLKSLEKFVEERRHIAARYDSGLETVEHIEPLAVDPRCRSNYYKYIALLDKAIDRDGLKRRLKQEFGVNLSGEVYTLPCHLHPLFDDRYAEGDFPNAESFCRRHVCLPLYPGMTDGEADRVIESLDKCLQG